MTIFFKIKHLNQNFITIFKQAPKNRYDNKNLTINYFLLVLNRKT